MKKLSDELLNDVNAGSNNDYLYVIQHYDSYEEPTRKLTNADIGGLFLVTRTTNTKLLDWLLGTFKGITSSGKYKFDLLYSGLNHSEIDPKFYRFKKVEKIA